MQAKPAAVILAPVRKRLRALSSIGVLEKGDRLLNWMASPDTSRTGPTAISITAKLSTAGFYARSGVERSVVSLAMPARLTDRVWDSRRSSR